MRRLSLITIRIWHAVLRDHADANNRACRPVGTGYLSWNRSGRRVTLVRPATGHRPPVVEASRPACDSGPAAHRAPGTGPVVEPSRPACDFGTALLKSENSTG